MSDKNTVISFSTCYNSVEEFNAYVARAESGEIKNQARYDEKKNVLDINVYTHIGAGGYNENTLTEDLKNAKEDTQVNLYINSGGGSLFSGIAMQNILSRRKAPVIATVDGIAASAASLLAMGADVIRAYDNTSLLIHEARGAVLGTAKDALKMGEALARVDKQLAEVYAKRTGEKEEDILNLMAEDKTLTAKESLEMKLIDEVIENESKEEFDNDFDMESFKNYLEIEKILNRIELNTDED